ncbi:MAG: hypothetical protein ACOCP4_00705 [Candidatus Woesearchaeota archaeon]
MELKINDEHGIILYAILEEIIPLGFYRIRATLKHKRNEAQYFSNPNFGIDYGFIITAYPINYNGELNAEIGLKDKYDNLYICDGVEIDRHHFSTVFSNPNNYRPKIMQEFFS